MSDSQKWFITASATRQYAVIMGWMLDSGASEKQEVEACARAKVELYRRIEQVGEGKLSPYPVNGRRAIRYRLKGKPRHYVLVAHDGEHEEPAVVGIHAEDFDKWKRSGGR